MRVCPQLELLVNKPGPGIIHLRADGAGDSVLLTVDVSIAIFLRGASPPNSLSGYFWEEIFLGGEISEIFT